MATKKAKAKKPAPKAVAKTPAKKAPVAPKKAAKTAPAAVSTPKITEKAAKKDTKKPQAPETMENCHVTGKCTGMGHCACCKWVAFLYILLAVFLAITLTKHMFYYSMYKTGNGKDGRCMYQKQDQMPPAPSAPIEPALPSSSTTPEAPGLPETPVVQ